MIKEGLCFFFKTWICNLISTIEPLPLRLFGVEIFVKVQCPSEVLSDLAFGKKCEAKFFAFLSNTFLNESAETHEFRDE